jgi:hypothetical protein
VFISHSADDAAVASEVCAAIEKRGIACWIAPRDIRAGDDFLESIQSAIESATAFVLVLSRSSTQSPFVLSETEVAFSYKRPIFPLRIEKVDPGGSLKMLLSRWHRVDAIGPGREAGLKRLADAVARRVSGGAGAREAPRPAAAAVAPVVPTRWSAFLGGPLWLLATGATGAAIALSCALLALALVGAGLGSGASGAALWLLLGWIAAGAATALLARPAKVPAGNGPAIAGALVASALLAFVLLGFTRQGEGIDVAANANPALNVVDAAAAPPPAARLDQEAIAAEENQRLHDLANDAANNAAPPAAVNAVANVLIDLTTMTSANSTSTELPPVNGM